MEPMGRFPSRPKIIRARLPLFHNGTQIEKGATRVLLGNLVAKPFTPRFPSSPLIIRVPFFLLFGFNKGTQKEKGKRVLLGNLVTVKHGGMVRLRTLIFGGLVAHSSKGLGLRGSEGFRVARA